uniref:Mos1 transposase HTH domain-containing protein n=1 Tax=Parascaris univalens TaxID=6257 RepID=A0A915A1F1_PARUN
MNIDDGSQFVDDFITHLTGLETTDDGNQGSLPMTSTPYYYGCCIVENGCRVLRTDNPKMSSTSNYERSLSARAYVKRQMNRQAFSICLEATRFRNDSAP